MNGRSPKLSLLSMRILTNKRPSGMCDSGPVLLQGPSRTLIKCKPRSALLNRKSRLNAPNVAEEVHSRSGACTCRNVRNKPLAIALVAASTTSPCNFPSLASEASSHLQLLHNCGRTLTDSTHSFLPIDLIRHLSSASVAHQKKSPYCVDRFSAHSLPSGPDLVRKAVSGHIHRGSVQRIPWTNFWQTWLF